MAKATLTTKDGTLVQVDGTPEEIARLMSLYGTNSSGDQKASTSRGSRSRASSKKFRSKAEPTNEAPSIDHIAIVNALKGAEEFDAIEQRILDRKSQLDRSLLPLYAVEELMGEKISLTTGDIEKVTAELGCRVQHSNASKKLKKSSLVMAMAARKVGDPTPYRINRRGIKYLSDVISGSHSKVSEH